MWHLVVGDVWQIRDITLTGCRSRPVTRTTISPVSITVLLITVAGGTTNVLRRAWRAPGTNISGWCTRRLSTAEWWLNHSKRAREKWRTWTPAGDVKKPDMCRPKGASVVLPIALPKSNHLFTARRYVSALYAVVVCMSVRHTPVMCQND